MATQCQNSHFIRMTLFGLLETFPCKSVLNVFHIGHPVLYWMRYFLFCFKCMYHASTYMKAYKFEVVPLEFNIRNRSKMPELSFKECNSQRMPILFHLISRLESQSSTSTKRPDAITILLILSPDVCFLRLDSVDLIILIQL